MQIDRDDLVRLLNMAQAYYDNKIAGGDEYYEREADEKTLDTIYKLLAIPVSS